MNVIQQLRQERQARGLSIATLAALMDVSPAALGSWERAGIGGRNGRNPALPQIESWAAALGFQPVLVPMEPAGVDYAAISAVVAALAAVADVAPTIEEMAEGIRMASADRIARYASVATCSPVPVAA